MTINESIILTYTGIIKANSFVAFAEHRARKLDLPLAVLSCDETSAVFAVEGQEALIDAFDMACSLGPYDCIIYETEQRKAPSDLFLKRNGRNEP